MTAIGSGGTARAEVAEPGPWYPGAHAAEGGHKPAAVIVPSGRAMTYAELDATANRLARLLRGRGVAPGDHVCLWFDNEILYPALWWGAIYAGLTYTLISARLTPREAAYIVEDSGSKVVLVGDQLAAQSGAALRSAVGGGVEIVVAEELVRLLGSVSSEPLEHRVEGVPMLYSSGTTGLPKAVKRPQSGAALGANPGFATALQFLFGMDRDAVYLSPAPLYHAAPHGFVTASLASGATVIVMEHFDPLELLAAIERYGVTHTQLVPTMFVRLLGLSEAERTRFDLSSLRCAIHAAAPCPVPIKEQMMDWWGPIIHEYYAGTENVGFTYCSPTDWLAHKGSVGRPVIGAVHIVDDDGQEVPAGVNGAVYFSGSPRFEYHNDPDKTKGSYLPNGWAAYGDVGRVDDDGFLYLTDRRADLILVGGVNVYPQEAENLLITHPAVADAAVFGVPQPEWGEEVKAVVQPVDLEGAGEDLAADLLAYLHNSLASIKCPRTIDFRADLPREPNGKLLKRLLRDEYAGATTPTTPE